MNRYGMIAQEHWKTYAPSLVAGLPDPKAFFSDLGLEVQRQVEALMASLAWLDSAEETYLEKAARLQTARSAAEEVVMAELVWIKDPQLPLGTGLREQTMPSTDEQAAAWRGQGAHCPSVGLAAARRPNHASAAG